MPVDESKRLKLAIGYRHADAKVYFTLSELKAGKRLVRKEIKVGIDRIARKGEEWQATLAGYEGAFWGAYNRGIESLYEAARVKGVEEHGVREFILSNPSWKQIIDEASDSLMRDIGRYIQDFSDDLLEEFLPGRTGTDFWEVFNDRIDTPTLDAYRSGGENFWLNVPLLQIRIDRDLLCLPWWLTRTYDKASLWCCRYALAVSPTLDDTEPPSIRLDKETGVHILSITRPTFDLEPWFPISKEAVGLAYPFIDEGTLSWRLLDGSLGDHNLARGKEGLFEHETTSASQPFKGVNKGRVRQALQVEENNPNIILYQGHWYKYQFDRSARPPYIFLHNINNVRYKKPEDITRPPISDLHLPVPLLDLIPTNSQNKILIMNGCSSATPLHQADYIEKYVSLKSVFIGTNYPTLTDAAGPSAGVLLTAMLKSQYLAHSILEVNWLDGSLQDEEYDTREIYKRAAICLFGDVRTSLVKEYNPDTKDNLSRLTLVITNRWDAGLRRLGLRDKEGMTFLTAPTDLSPTGDFSLTREKYREGVQVALVPLVVGIDLCMQDPGIYVILGPAFSSKESVALISRRFKNWEDFYLELERRRSANKKIVLGILANRLTSTYMTRLVLKNVLERKYGAAQAHEILKDHIDPRPAHWEGQGTEEDLSSGDFLNNVDLSLSLNKTPEQLKALSNINILETDLETQAAHFLQMEVSLLSRGIFITKRKCLKASEEKFVIVEFCDLFNDAVQQYKSSNSAIAPDATSLKYIPLYTYDKVDTKQLLAIQRFAQTDFFNGMGFGWEHFSHMPRTKVASVELKKIVAELTEFTNSELESLGVLTVDKLKVLQAISALAQGLTSRVESQTSWPLSGLENILDDELKKQKLQQGRVGDEIRGRLLHKVEELGREVVEAPYGGQEIGGAIGGSI